jgi:hypothetical protein
MNGKVASIRTAAVAAGIIVVGLTLTAAWLYASDSRREPAAGKLIVHEWGTFTGFSGSNGVNLEFRPLVTNDLPRFIMNAYRQPGSPTAAILKSQYVALQRMETPVTYFYTDQPRVVNVRVDFPKGMLSEWYPVVKSFDSGKDDEKQSILGNAYLDWGTVRLTPPDEFAEVRVRGEDGKVIPASLPPVPAPDDYARARETDSAIVETVDALGGSHFEKFLFYRGLGNFELPIKLVGLGNDRFEIANSSNDASGALILVRIEKSIVRFARIERVSPRSAIEVRLPSEASTVDKLAAATARELVAAGLYEKEAWAMLNTWRTSWFGEAGTRLLYLLPSQQTDELLPLAIDPAPDERVRVLVGRLETLTPEDSRRLAQALAGGNPSEQPTSQAVLSQLHSLGRFAEPAVQSVLSQSTDPTTRGRLEVILSEIRTGKIAEGWHDRIDY